MLIAFAAFQSGQNFEDLLALFAIGLIGIFLRRFDWSRPAFLIGFVLSNPVEKFSNQAFQIASFRFRNSFEDGMGYIFSPIVIVLLIITVVSVVPGSRQAKAIMPVAEVENARSIDYSLDSQLPTAAEPATVGVLYKSSMVNPRSDIIIPSPLPARRSRIPSSQRPVSCWPRTSSKRGSCSPVRRPASRWTIPGSPA